MTGSGRATPPGSPPPFHPDLVRARFLPATVVGRRTYRLARVATRLGPRARDVDVVQVADGVRARVHRPPPGSRTPVPGALYLHGGGYVIGTAAMGDRFCARLALHLGVVVMAVDYRLAPEHPYPAALEDAAAGLRWLAEQPEVDPQRIALVGDSAGGGLAAAVTLLARDRGEVGPVAQVLAYPMLDDRTADGGVDPRVLRLWNQRSNRFGWEAYLGSLAGGEVPATAAPARAEELSGLPATWIGVGTHDLFHAENARWAQRLEAAAVPCELHVVDGAYHGFDRAEPHAEVSAAFLRARLAALRRALADPT